MWDICELFWRNVGEAEDVVQTGEYDICPPARKVEEGSQDKGEDQRSIDNWQHGIRVSGVVHI